jgi:hypothetical protein
MLHESRLNPSTDLSAFLSPASDCHVCISNELDEVAAYANDHPLFDLPLLQLDTPRRLRKRAPSEDTLTDALSLDSLSLTPKLKRPSVQTGFAFG